MDLGRPFDLIAHPAQGAALAVLAGADNGFTPPQVQRIAGRFSVDGIRRALERLSALGVVTSERMGNATCYRLNRDHLAAEAIISLARIRQRFINLVAAEIAGWPVGPEYAALFGSAARDSMRPDSDIDVFIVRPDDVDPDDKGWLVQLDMFTDAGRRWTGNPVNVLEFSASEATANARAGDRVLDDISREGIVLHGPAQYLSAGKRTVHGQHEMR